jgi:hypothetical protein
LFNFLKIDLHFIKTQAMLSERLLEAVNSMGDADDRPPPLRQLGDDDLEFIQRLVLASGSLKDLAQGYGVSYPTIRARLDKLIERLEARVRGQPPDPMADLLADLIAKGEVAPSAARAVLKLHRDILKKAKEV